MSDIDYITLSTGRKFYGNGGIIGIDAKGEVFSGYDDSSVDKDFLKENDWIPTPWPLADRIALADLMIARWTTYRKKTEEEKNEIL